MTTNHKTMDTANLASVPKLAETIGVVTQTIRSYMEEEGFPAPVYDNGAEKSPQRLYDVTEVVAWVGRKREAAEIAKTEKAATEKAEKIARLEAQLAALKGDA